MSLTPAGPADLPALLPMMAAFYAEEGLPWSPARAEAAMAGLLADPALGLVWLVGAEGRGSQQGYVVVTAGYSLEFAGRYALLDELYLQPAARGRGLGAAALRHVADACRARGFAAVRLEVERHNARARGLYARAGFLAHDRDLMTLAL